VPAITDGDFKLAESSAIMKYLIESNKGSFSEHLWPKDEKKRAEIDSLIEWKHCEFRPALIAVFFHNFIMPMKGIP
jgi:glutathione S-transferase